MKTIKTILIAAVLIGATAVSSLSAQQAAPAQAHSWQVAVGDSVMIKRECQKYLTGETPSAWVWDKVHIVRQLGSKRFPEGILLMNIYSWMCEDCLVPANAKEAAPAPVEEEIIEEQPVEEPKVEEPIEEPAPVEEPIQEQPVEEAAPIEEPAPVVDVVAHEQAKGDTIKSQQHFRGSYDRFTIGLRGGAASLMHHAQKGNWTCGGDVVLDLQYAYYWTKDGRPVDLGLIVGLGIGYAQSGLNTASDSTAFTKDKVDYTVVTKDVKETDHQLQLEVPLMFSLIADNGVFFNIGPKFMIPVYTPYNQSINKDETHIAAYVQETGITTVDNPVTGQYNGEQPTVENGIQFKLNVMLTAELGYEWILNSGNSLGLGAYANYSVFNSFKNTTSAEGLFNLTAPTDDDKAHVDVQSATKTYADKLGYFDAGIKVAYHFNFPKKRKTKDAQLF